MNFLPDNYEAPQGGGHYMKLQKGDNKFRILSAPILGWLDWKDKQPHRFEFDKKPQAPMGENPIKHFWAMIVWNYQDQAVQILEVTQSTIQKSIQDLSKDVDWGHPSKYDIKVNRKGDGLTTEYSVIPGNKSDIPEDIRTLAEQKPCDLNALFHGADPWNDITKQTEYFWQEMPF